MTALAEATYTEATLPWQTQPGGVQTAEVVLAQGESAWNPASTKSLIHGPAQIAYARYLDGGVDVWIA